MIKKLTIAAVALLAAGTARAQVSTLYGDTVAGSPTSGIASSSAKFTSPFAAIYNGDNSVLWITDEGNNYIECITNNKIYIREGNLAGGFQDGGGADNGLVSGPKGIVMRPYSKNDTLYLVDWGGNAIRKMVPWVDAGHSQYLSTIAGGGPGSTPEFLDGTGKAARFNLPVGIGYIKDKNGDYLVVSDQGNNVIRKVSLAKADYGKVTLLSGKPGSTGGYADGALADAQFNAPAGVFVDTATNDVYITDNNGIRLLSTSKGTVSTVLQQKYMVSNASSVVKMGKDLFIAEGCRISHYIIGSTPEFAKNPENVAGDETDMTCSWKDGANALFNNISFMTLSSDQKYLIVTDQYNNAIRKVTINHTSAIETIYAGKEQFKVYPNPAFGHIMVTSAVTGPATISLVNITGQQVMSQNIQLNANQAADLDITQVSPGIYTLQVATAQGVHSSKVVVK